MTASQTDDSRDTPNVQDGTTAFSRRGDTTHQPQTIDHFLSKRSREIAAIRDELENFEIKICDSGNDQYSATPMHHDDLVCSLGIAAYLALAWGTRTIEMW